jgi:hypothetical protein
MSEIAMSTAQLLGAVRRHLSGQPLLVLLRLVAVSVFAVALLLLIIATGVYVVVRPVVETVAYAAAFAFFAVAYALFTDSDEPDAAAKADEGPVTS